MAESTVQQSRSRDLDKLLLRPGNLVAPTFEPGAQVSCFFLGEFNKQVVRNNS